MGTPQYHVDSFISDTTSDSLSPHINDDSNDLEINDVLALTKENDNSFNLISFPSYDKNYGELSKNLINNQNKSDLYHNKVLNDRDVMENTMNNFREIIIIDN